MHICIPDTREVRPASGGAYVLYNVHIDGLYHCSLRYKQLLHLHQNLVKQFTGPYHQLSQFPPKRLLPLSASQLEERRSQLEKYLQNISQDKAISHSTIFNLFLLEAQRESTRLREKQVHLDIELVNGQKIRLPIVTHESADGILTAVCRTLGLDDRYHAYFCLCLCGYDVVRDKLIIKRRLSFFESPYITLQMAIQQQEQLQNVLSSSGSGSSTATGSGSFASSNAYLTATAATNSSSDCRCLSCASSPAMALAHYQQAVAQETTSVPLVGSSSGSTTCPYNNRASHYNNNSNSYLQNRHSSSSSSQQLAHHSSIANRSFVTHRILLRKSYWDPIYDTHILNDQQTLDLLFIQTVYDLKHSLMFVDKETYQRLESLLASDSKLEYILLARTLEYYNYVHFEPCYSDYPKPRTKVMISIGSKELNMRVLKSPKSINSASSSSTAASATAQQAGGGGGGSNGEPILYCTSSLVPSSYRHLITKNDIVEEEHNFKVPLIRCWRLTSLETLNSNEPTAQNQRQSTSSATTTLAGGKRRSLSLFNSVVGNSNNQSNGFAAAANSHFQSGAARTLLSSGNDGNSLMAALNGSRNGDSLFRNSNGHHHQFCQHENQRCSGDQLDQTQFSQYELSFEYLMSKDSLKWITISSDQAIFISISLQGVVDELVSKRDGRNSSLYPTSDRFTLVPAPLISRGANGPSNSNAAGAEQTENFTYLYRDGQQKRLNSIANSYNQFVPANKFNSSLGGESHTSNATSYSSDSSADAFALAQARQRKQVRVLSLLPSSSAAAAAGQAPRRGLTSFATTNWLGGSSSSASQQIGQFTNIAAIGCNPTGSLEISSFKKAPSPIINDAFEGVTNDDDL